MYHKLKWKVLTVLTEQEIHKILKLLLLSSDCYLKILDCEVDFYITPSASNISPRLKALETPPIKSYLFPGKMSYQVEIVYFFSQVSHVCKFDNITLGINNPSDKVLHNKSCLDLG